MKTKNKKMPPVTFEEEAYCEELRGSIEEECLKCRAFKSYKPCFSTDCVLSPLCGMDPEVINAWLSATMRGVTYTGPDITIPKEDHVVLLNRLQSSCSECASRNNKVVDDCQRRGCHFWPYKQRDTLLPSQNGTNRFSDETIKRYKITRVGQEVAGLEVFLEYPLVTFEEPEFWPRITRRFTSLHEAFERIEILLLLLEPGELKEGIVLSYRWDKRYHAGKGERKSGEIRIKPGCKYMMKQRMIESVGIAI